VNRRRLLRGAYFRPGPAPPSQLYWAPVLSMSRFWTNARLRAGIAGQARFFQDAALGRLPAISYVLPSPNTHWPTPPRRSEERVLSIVDAVRKSPSWERTALFLVWDDWGGFYDHVPPPQTHALGLGFRVPALLISPYAKRGFVSHVRHDHTSIPAFVAETFKLSRVGNRYSDGSFREAWTDRPHQDPIRTTGTVQPYAASGREHAGAVFVIYLVGLIVPAGTLLALRRRS
jgi:phospholipase C